ncbi:hypothetical protein CYMTET_51336, partial [Cymbomonas tetramitiformis]
AHQHGYTALMRASKNGHGAVVERLVEAGADPNHADQEGYTAMTLASLHGDEAVVEMLIEAGADLNRATGYQRETALMVASYNGHEAVVEMLVEAGADPNHAGKEGKTALMLASLHGHEAVVGRLVEAGADPNHAAYYVFGQPPPEDKPGKNALSVVVSQQQAQINELVEQVRRIVQSGATAPKSEGAASTALTTKTSDSPDAHLPTLSSMLKGIPADRYFAGLNSESETLWLEFKARVAPSCRHPSMEILPVETRDLNDIKTDPLYSDRANRLLYDFLATVTCQTAQGIVRAYASSADGCAAW